MFEVVPPVPLVATHAALSVGAVTRQNIDVVCREGMQTIAADVAALSSDLATQDGAREVVDALIFNLAVEAEALASDLAATGGLGWFVVCVTGGWNDLTERDRLQAAWCWECAILGMSDSIAA